MIIPYFVYPIIAFSLAQGIKMILKVKDGKKLRWHDLVAYSDMPSGHTATVISISTILALRFGLYSAEFALSFVFAVIVISDAIGLRNYMGQHGKTLNVLVKDLKEDDFLDNTYPKQLERIGHTPLQVLMGGLLGASVGIIGYLFF